MYATVTAVDGDDVVLEVAPGVEVRYLKRAIMEVIASGEADEAETYDDGESEPFDEHTPPTPRGRRDPRNPRGCPRR